MTREQALEQALQKMWEFASRMSERHGINGDDTMTDVDHRDWQEASGEASVLLGAA